MKTLITIFGLGLLIGHSAIAADTIFSTCTGSQDKTLKVELLRFDNYDKAKNNWMRLVVNGEHHTIGSIIGGDGIENDFYDILRVPHQQAKLFLAKEDSNGVSVTLTVFPAVNPDEGMGFLNVAGKVTNVKCVNN